MCGRFALDFNQDDLMAQFEDRRLTVKSQPPRFKPSYNVAPTKSSPVYHSNKVLLMNWGLIPHWTKAITKAQQYKTFNARAETVLTSKMWSKVIKSSRCVVPISGYYEWETKQSKKVPYFVRRKDGNVAFLAGMFDEVKVEGGENILSFTIVTGPAPKALQWLHKRMPVVLEPGSSEWEAWLDDDKQDWDEEYLSRILSPKFDSNIMEHYRVPLEVGKVSQNYKALMEPLNTGIKVFFPEVKKSTEPAIPGIIKVEEEITVKDESPVKNLKKRKIIPHRDIVELLRNSKKKRS
ncbi:HFL063Cp [Eremothecium sinecaudum]|uniref:HFL063Cp n=1 Tax=Eremothecium sinecaudum TaxID=45286 RepID=A0A109UZZ2_9SACH|nr:HFL063Cp [Eremothecium sinecaudum]AMD21793.1 HFL063Cp [Eremothecium sinecaudum]